MKIIDTESTFLNEIQILSKYFNTDKANIIELIKPIKKNNRLFQYVLQTLVENKLIAIDTNVLKDYNLIIQDFSLKQKKCKIEIFEISSEATELLKKANLYFISAIEKIRTEL